MILKIGRKSVNRAFTLLETIVVLAIIAMFFAISVPFFAKFTENTKLETSTRSVTSALRTARTYAITYNALYYVAFDTTTTPHSYFVSADGANPTDKREKLPIGIWFYNPATAGDGIGFTKGPTTKEACFKPTGELDETASNTSLIMADKQAAGANYKTITVEKTTGRARIE